MEEKFEKQCNKCTNRNTPICDSCEWIESEYIHGHPEHYIEECHVRFLPPNTTREILRMIEERRSIPVDLVIAYNLFILLEGGKSNGRKA